LKIFIPEILTEKFRSKIHMCEFRLGFYFLRISFSVIFIFIICVIYIEQYAKHKLGVLLKGYVRFAPSVV